MTTLNRKMKPETIARRKLEHEVERAANKASLRTRLQALVDRDGPTSIWAEMLAEGKPNA